jgi:RNA polymerase sigma-70 factor (ECF subfamily)
MPIDSPIDEAAFEVLFKEHFIPLCAWCQYKFNFELEVAKDAVHSSFIKLWENRDSLSTEIPVKSYLYKVANNLSIDLIRHEKVKRRHMIFVNQHISPNTDNEAFDQLDLKRMAESINLAILALPEQMRLIFELSRNEGLKYAEISDRLNISVKTVETQMSRALAKLRKQLIEYLPILPWVIISMINFFQL